MISFSGIDEIEWSSLQHAYGSAGDIPDLLMQLASEDSAVRNRANHELLGNIWHQGTVYEATPHAVPFLCQIALEAPIPNRVLALLLLGSIADAGLMDSGYPKGAPWPRQCTDAVKGAAGSLLGLAVDAGVSVGLALSFVAVSTTGQDWSPLTDRIRILAGSESRSEFADALRAALFCLGVVDPADTERLQAVASKNELGDLAEPMEQLLSGTADNHTRSLFLLDFISGPLSDELAQ